MIKETVGVFTASGDHLFFTVIVSMVTELTWRTLVVSIAPETALFDIHLTAGIFAAIRVLFTGYGVTFAFSSTKCNLTVIACSAIFIGFTGRHCVVAAAIFTDKSFGTVGL